MSEPVVSWGSACGRHYLSVNGIAVAMESDPCRDRELVLHYGSRVWTDKMIVDVAEGRFPVTPTLEATDA